MKIPKKKSTKIPKVKPFEKLFIDKGKSTWYDKYKCPKCRCRLRTDFNFIYCSYVKCDWYEAYLKEREE